MGRLEGKVALVTGAGRGIGRGIALCMAEEGADLVVNDLPLPAGLGALHSETAEQIEALGRRVHVHYADVAEREQVQAMVAAAVERLGRLDIVVANAAVSVRQPVVEAQWEGVRRTIDVTQLGVFHTCQAAAQHMVARGGGGKIIIIGSLLSEVPLPTSAAYNMAKAAVNHLGRTLAAELAPARINVNVINPGWIDTPGERLFVPDEEIRRVGPRMPWGRLGTQRDIGRTAVFLASDDADYISGSAITVDGAYRASMSLPLG